MNKGGRVVVSARDLIGAIAHCSDCGKRWEKYRSARDSARRHAKKYGHRTSVEVTYFIEYGTKTK